MGHSKRDCPVKKWDWGTSKTTAAAAPKVSKFEKQKDGRSSGEGPGTGSEGARQVCSPGSAEEASREVTGRIPNTAPPNSVAMGGGTPKPPQDTAEAAGMSEVAGLLKSLRSMKALQIKYEAAKRNAGEAEDLEPVALLDGGATHALRQARSHEKNNLTAVEVELACGSTVLYKHPGTSALLTLDPVEPIIPLRMLVNAGFVVKWNAKGCIIDHPEHSRLHCWLRHGCPVMKRSAAMKLMDFLDAPDGHAAVTTDREWWLQQFPHLPEEVLEFMGRVEDGTEAAARSPFNRGLRRRWEKSKGLVVHLFAGKDAREWRREDWKGYEVITIDMEENARQNLHDAALWGYLWYLARKGLIRAVIGGPPRRTISRLRHNPPGPKPLRGRDQRRYGLPGLSMEDRRKVNGDTALFFKQMALWLIAEDSSWRKGNQVGFLGESPMDPAKYDPRAEELDIPSFWNFEEVREFCRDHGMILVDLDQGAAGHPRRKPTTLATNLPGMGELHGLKGHGHQEMEANLQRRLVQTKTWSKWAPGMVAAIKKSLKVMIDQLEEGSKEKVAETGELKKMTLERWKEHVKRGHAPFNRRCRVCMQEAGIDRPHKVEGRHTGLCPQCGYCWPILGWMMQAPGARSSMP